MLWPFWADAKGRLAAAVAAMVVSSAMLLAIGWALKCVIDWGFDDPSGHMLDQAMAAMFVLVMLLAAAAYLRQVLVNTLAERAIAGLRGRLFAHVMGQDAAYFDGHGSGELMTRINADTTVLQILMTGQLPTLLRHSLMLAGGIVMLCVVSPLMTGILLVSVPLVIGPIFYFGRKVRARSRSTQESLGVLTGFGVEHLQGVRTVQSFSQETPSAQAFDALANDTLRHALKQIRARALMTAVVIFIAFSAVVTVLWAGGQKVLTGDMTAGELSAFIFYAATVAGSLMNLGEVSGEVSRAAGAADRIAQVLAQSSTLKGQGMPLPQQPYDGHVVFRDVTFTYPRREQAALSGVSFDIPAGRTTAIVGPSGAGKSTLFQLIQRFYDADSGQILIDGVDIATADPKEIRKLVAVVSQDPMLFSTTVADNIRMARPDAPDADVEAAARMAQAHDFIMALPQGYQTPVGERGSNLSGGQKQRIAIARAFLKDAKILLLDEATSALDTLNEHAVYEALSALSHGRTTVVIAHKLSTIYAADQILVMDHGRITASGTHDSLTQSSETYRNLSFAKAV